MINIFLSILILISVSQLSAEFNLKRFLAEDFLNYKYDELQTTPMSDPILTFYLDKFEEYDNDQDCFQSEVCAEEWMNEYNFLSDKINEKSASLEYEFDTNITEENQKKVDDFVIIPNRFQEIGLKIAKRFVQNCREWNAPLRRKLFLASLGTVTKDTNDTILLSNLTNTLTTIFGVAKVCNKNECLVLDPDITDIMTESRDYDRLLYVWKGWHDATGRKMRKPFTKTVEIQNKAAKENGYKDLSERWLEDFEEENFEQMYDKLFEEIKPLYQLLHTYVKNKLDLIYGSKYPANHNSSLIQAHLLGNMWAQDWQNIYDLVVPFPNENDIQVTANLKKKNLTSIDLFKQAEDFFTSMGLYPMTPAFWKNSMIERPKNREVICHASAFDFYNGFDFRIKMCTQMDEEYFSTIHHEMGHIQYFMAYSDQPSIFRTGANSGFHEAIGDTISLSVMSPTHLKKLKLTENESLNYKQNINYLMKQALKKISFLPFGYLMDKWRWAVFRGEINETNYNQKWWEMRTKYQGLEAPVERSEQDFDPGAKYHIASYTPYSRYFVSHLHQFQFYKALCQLSNHQGPLHTCDFYRSKKAGRELKKMLKLGASKHWHYALKQLTGEKTLNANALFDYFMPLKEYLESENQKINSNFM